MRLLVCVKRVPFTGGKMVLTADSMALETRHLGFTISPHEECGVEEAVRLIEAGAGESVVLTLGPAEAVEQLRDAMALGIDRAIHLQTDGGEWDPEATPIPLKLSTPPTLRDNALAALYLASDESRYISGVSLPTTDGGTLAKVAT